MFISQITTTKGTAMRKKVQLEEFDEGQKGPSIKDIKRVKGMWGRFAATILLLFIFWVVSSTHRDNEWITGAASFISQLDLTLVLAVGALVGMATLLVVAIRSFIRLHKMTGDKNSQKENIPGWTQGCGCTHDTQNEKGHCHDEHC